MGNKSLLLTNRNLQDLNPLIAGQERCKSGHSFGPRVREYTLIHYVLRGRGVLYDRRGAHPVEAGQAFLILPGEVTTYTADGADPWHYCWIGFNGRLAKDFAQLPPVFSLQEDLFHGVLHPGGDDGMLEYRLAASLFQLYAHLFSSGGSENRHVRRVEDFIRASYMMPVRVEEIADSIGLNRRYLSRLFRENTGQTIQEYLITVRMEAARRYLSQGCSVKEAADLCGYEDVSNFSKMFKRRWGKSPAAYGR